MLQPSSSLFHFSGIGKCPILGLSLTSPKNSSHLVDHEYRSWLGDVKNGDMTNDPYFSEMSFGAVQESPGRPDHSYP